MTVDWQQAALYLWPIGIALAVGFTGWWLLMALTRRLRAVTTGVRALPG